MTTLTPTRQILVEALVGTAIALAAVALANQPALGIGLLHPHPIWLVILVLAARYGARGLVVAAPIGWGALVLLSALWAPAGAAGWLRGTPARFLSALATPGELGALAGAVMVGWVASVHERRERASAERSKLLEQRASVDAGAIDELRRAALALRARNDRLDVSLTFLRSVARRLEGSDPAAAAEAALELATARLGARAAAVLLLEAPGRDAEALVAFAVTGVWSSDGGALGVDNDGTVAAVVRTGAPTRAMDLPAGGPNDSDLAAPIAAAGGPAPVVRGVLAVRGVPRGGVGAAALRDLAVIAEWSAAALARAKSDRGSPARLAAPVRDAVPKPTPFPPKTGMGPSPHATVDV